LEAPSHNIIFGGAVRLLRVI